MPKTLASNRPEVKSWSCHLPLVWPSANVSSLILNFLLCRIRIMMLTSQRARRIKQEIWYIEFGISVQLMVGVQQILVPSYGLPCNFNQQASLKGLKTAKMYFFKSTFTNSSVYFISRFSEISLRYTDPDLGEWQDLVSDLTWIRVDIWFPGQCLERQTGPRMQQGWPEDSQN